jgi:hypothetical protein
MGRGCEITKHLKIAYRHLFYYSDVFDVGIFVLDDGFMKGFFFALSQVWH